ncbi:MAG: hypothetical protein M1827_001957 [Pycnora praestabilis]|nr:MAG: hypothetical protein M1827_001957 [Pycnora praestabilis]
MASATITPLPTANSNARHESIPANRSFTTAIVDPFALSFMQVLKRFPKSIRTLPCPNTTQVALAVFALLVGVIGTYLTVRPTQESLQLARWTALKDFMEDCEQRKKRLWVLMMRGKESGEILKKECNEVLKETLPPPPLIYDYLSNGIERRCMPAETPRLDTRVCLSTTVLFTSATAVFIFAVVLTKMALSSDLSILRAFLLLWLHPKRWLRLLPYRLGELRELLRPVLPRWRSDTRKSTRPNVSIGSRIRSLLNVIPGGPLATSDLVGPPCSHGTQGYFGKYELDNVASNGGPIRLHGRGGMRTRIIHDQDLTGRRGKGFVQQRRSK